MSSLMKNTVTQENPIYNINVPPPPTDSSTTSDITPVVVTQAAEQVDESTIVAITTLPAVPSNETLSFLEIKKKKKGISHRVILAGWPKGSTLFFYRNFV